jgi:uncharacterized membrane protein HdeD (DUF308 family)
VLLGILMLVLGTLAVTLPNVSTLEIELLVGCLFIVGGLFRILTIFRKRHIPGFWWLLSSGVVALACGVLLLARPLQGVISLTIVMMAFFAIQGIATIIFALESRRNSRHWGWPLLSGAIDLMLAFLIWKGWPNNATWVIGLYAGISMVFVGLALIMIAMSTPQPRTIST